MATSDTNTDREGRTRVAAYVLAGLVLVATAVAVLAFRGAPPQMGADEDVFNTVDALYTAVRMRDDRQVTACEARLNGYRDAGKLPADAADSLDGIIAKARAGSWETAAERLYEFMSAQTREGAAEPKPHKHKHPQKKGTK